VRRRECPLCGRRLRAFKAHAGRAHALCPHCGSLERHRHLWLYLERHTTLLSQPATLVHVAPDAATARRLAALEHLDYIAGDIDGERGDRVLDLTALPLADASVDALIAYHVLEHVPDDHRAFTEMARVLKPSGRAFLQVPTRAGPTVEDAAVTSGRERRERFGQDDHVRHYGDDFPDRVRAAGLACRAVVFRDELSRAERERYGLEYAEASHPEDDRLWQVFVASRA
jgi:SAM-dependent methyltransferase